MKPEKGSEGGRAIKNELWPRKRREGGRSVTYHLLGERRKGGKLNFTPKLAEETKIKRFRLHYRNFFWGGHVTLRPFPLILEGLFSVPNYSPFLSGKSARDGIRERAKLSTDVFSHSVLKC